MLVSIDWILEHQTDPNLILIDARPKISYAYGHPPKSQSLTIDQLIEIDQYGSNLVPDEKTITEIFSTLGIDESKTVVVCGDSLDPSAARIAWTLLYYGHEKTFLLDSSISVLQSKVKFTRAPFKPSRTTFAPKINHDMRIDADNLKNNLFKFKILDARSPQEFLGGHIPKAILHPFTDGIGLDGKLFQEKELLIQRFKEKKIDETDEVVCYCMHGHRASNLFFQLKLAGWKKVRLYDGSFVQWYGKRFPLD